MSEPLVSVHMITYNHALYIAQAIESVLAQKTDFPFELVIGEDCSTDGTREIVFDYAKRYPDIIRVITSDTNVGTTANGNRTDKACRGKYIAYCEGDDYWHRDDKLQMQVDYLESHPECGLVCSDYDMHYLYSQQQIKGYGKTSGKTALHQPQITDILRGNACIQTLTVTARRALIDDVKKADPFLFGENFKMGDTQLWAEMSLISKIHFMEESLATHQILEESATRSKDRKKVLYFRLSGAELCIYLCQKHKLPHAIEEIHNKIRRRITLKLAFIEKRPELAREVKQKYPHLTVKDKIWYLGATKPSMRPLVLLLEKYFSKSHSRSL